MEEQDDISKFINMVIDDHSNTTELDRLLGRKSKVTDLAS